MDSVNDILDEVLAESNDVASTAEANDQTIPEGLYILQFTKANPEIASEKSPWPGRVMVRARADATLKTTSERKGSVFCDLSPQTERTRTGRLDSASVLWGQAVQALNMVNASKREIVDALCRFPFEGYVKRTFKVPQFDGTNRYVKPDDKDHETKLLTEGAKPVNFVSNLRPVR